MVIPCVGDGLGICQAVPMVSCVPCGAQWLCCVEVRAPAGRGLERLPVPRELKDCGARAYAQLANARGHQENMVSKNALSSDSHSSDHHQSFSFTHSLAVPCGIWGATSVRIIRRLSPTTYLSSQGGAERWHH
jgi:hypothetical protein